MRTEEDIELPKGLAALEPTIIAPIKLPKRGRNAHKGSFGRVNIFGGSIGYTGAPVLAAAGAVKTGAGLVRVGVPASAYPAVAAKLVCAMPYPLQGKDGLAVLGDMLKDCRGVNGVLIGPGWGMTDGAPDIARGVIEFVDAPMVVDADGLNALAGHIDVLKARRDKVTVLTPHFGELRRLLGKDPKRPTDPAEDYYARAREFAMEHGCVLVFKGHRTATFLPGGRVVVNTTGNPGMATGGAGDVLAGMIVSLLGQGFPPDWAVPAAVYLHGRAGDMAAEELGEYAMTAADLVGYLPKAMLEAERRGED